MAIGLSEQELNRILSFGDTPQEIKANIFGSLAKSADLNEILASIVFSLGEKISRVVLENNKSIHEQLISVGINLPD